LPSLDGVLAERVGQAVRKYRKRAADKTVGVVDGRWPSHNIRELAANVLLLPQCYLAKKSSAVA